jgi:hypothetical protein
VRNNKLLGALTIHVDDLVIVGEPSFINEFIPALGKCFKKGADEDLHHFLSMKITCNAPNRHIFLPESHYIDELCKRFLNGQHTNQHQLQESSLLLAGGGAIIGSV